MKLSKPLEAFFYAFNSRWKFSLTLIAIQCFTNVLKEFSSLWTTFCYLLLCMIFPLLLWYTMSNSWWHLTCIQFAVKAEFCRLSLCGFFITVSRTSNITDLTDWAFTESVNIKIFNITFAACECGTEKNCQSCFPQMSNPLTYPWIARHCPDGSGWWDNVNWMAAQALLDDLA